MNFNPLATFLEAPGYLQAVYIFSAILILALLYLGPYATYSTGLSNLRGK